MLPDRLRLPIILVAMHTALLTLLAPLILATINSEAAPFGFAIIGILDLPVFFIVDYLIPEKWVEFDSDFGQFVLFPFFAGSLQWFFIGLVVSFISDSGD